MRMGSHAVALSAALVLSASTAPGFKRRNEIAQWT